MRNWFMEAGDVISESFQDLGQLFTTNPLTSIKQWSDTMVENGQQMVITVLIVLAVLLLIAIIYMVVSKKVRWTASQLAIGAICIAIAFILSYLRLFKMPQGGSVTLASMLPIMVFAYLYGFKKGLVVGIAYGLLQAIQDPWIVHPIQFMLDYGVAFMALALAGLFKKIVPGMIIAGIVRYLAHAVSGFVFFSEYAPEGQHVLIYSAAYNSFVFVDLAICIVVVLVPPVMKFIMDRKAKMSI